VELLDDRIVRVRRFLDALANGARKIEAGAHRERHQVDDVRQAAAHVLQAVLRDAADLACTNDPADEEHEDRDRPVVGEGGEPDTRDGAADGG